MPQNYLSIGLNLLVLFQYSLEFHLKIDVSFNFIETTRPEQLTFRSLTKLSFNYDQIFAIQNVK